MRASVLHCGLVPYIALTPPSRFCDRGPSVARRHRPALRPHLFSRTPPSSRIAVSPHQSHPRHRPVLRPHPFSRTPSSSRIAVSPHQSHAATVPFCGRIPSVQWRQQKHTKLRLEMSLWAFEAAKSRQNDTTDVLPAALLPCSPNGTTVAVADKHLVISCFQKRAP